MLSYKTFGSELGVCFSIKQRKDVLTLYYFVALRISERLLHKTEAQTELKTQTKFKADTKSGCPLIESITCVLYSTKQTKRARTHDTEERGKSICFADTFEVKFETRFYAGN